MGQQHISDFFGNSSNVRRNVYREEKPEVEEVVYENNRIVEDRSENNTSSKRQKIIHIRGGKYYTTFCSTMFAPIEIDIFHQCVDAQTTKVPLLSSRPTETITTLSTTVPTPDQPAVAPPFIFVKMLFAK